MSHAAPVVLPRPFDDNLDRNYIDQLIRALEQALHSLDSIHALGASTLFLTALPTNGNMQRIGTVYDDAGTLKIVQANTGYAPSFEIESSIGTVSVTVS